MHSPLQRSTQGCVAGLRSRFLSFARTYDGPSRTPGLSSQVVCKLQQEVSVLEAVRRLLCVLLLVL